MPYTVHKAPIALNLAWHLSAPYCQPPETVTKLGLLSSSSELARSALPTLAVTILHHQLPPSSPYLVLFNHVLLTNATDVRMNTPIFIFYQSLAIHHKPPPKTHHWPPSTIIPCLVPISKPSPLILANTKHPALTEYSPLSTHHAATPLNYSYPPPRPHRVTVNFSLIVHFRLLRSNKENPVNQAISLRSAWWNTLHFRITISWFFVKIMFTYSTLSHDFTVTWLVYYHDWLIPHTHAQRREKREERRPIIEIRSRDRKFMKACCIMSHVDFHELARHGECAL